MDIVDTYWQGDELVIMVDTHVQAGPHDSGIRSTRFTRKELFDQLKQPPPAPPPSETDMLNLAVDKACQCRHGAKVSQGQKDHARARALEQVRPKP